MTFLSAQAARIKQTLDQLDPQYQAPRDGGRSEFVQPARTAPHLT